MSASTEKKLRKENRAAGIDKKQQAADKAAAEARKSDLKWIIIGICFVALVIFCIFAGNSMKNVTNATALTVGDRDYSVAEFNCALFNCYQGWMQQNGEMAPYYFDTSAGIRGLKSQQYDETSTWLDYFVEMTKSEISQKKALTDYAAANGIVLTEDDLADVENALANDAFYASLYGFESVDSFYSANYGKGITSDVMRATMTEDLLANKVLQALADEKNASYAPEELAEYYESLNGDKDYYDYAQYYVSADEVETVKDDGTTTSAVTDETLDVSYEAVQAIAETYRNMDGDDYSANFDAAIAEYKEDATQTDYTGTLGANVNTIFADWVKGDRTPGDVETFKSTYGSFVVVYYGHSDNDYNTVSVRHILIKTQADEEGNYTDAARDIAKMRAEDILAEWKTGEATEDSFAALAVQYSEDGGSAENGGLYENIYKGQMVEEFNDFCFGEGRQPGDVDILYGNNGGYDGYHVVYFVKEGENFCDLLAKTELTNEYLQAFVDEAVAGMTIVPGKGYKHIG